MNIYDEAIATFHDMHPEYDTANGGTHLLHDKVLDALKCAKKEHKLLELYRRTYQPSLLHPLNEQINELEEELK